MRAVDMELKKSLWTLQGVRHTRSLQTPTHRFHLRLHTYSWNEIEKNSGHHRAFVVPELFRIPPIGFTCTLMQGAKTYDTLKGNFMFDMLTSSKFGFGFKACAVIACYSQHLRQSHQKHHHVRYSRHEHRWCSHFLAIRYKKQHYRCT